MRKTILVADDSKTIQKVVELTFKATGFLVESVSSGEHALARCSQSNQPDLVLADASMPGQDGYDLAMALKSNSATAHIPVVLLAGNSEPLDENRAMRARIDGHIKKPFDSQSLIDLIKQQTGVPLDNDQPLSFAAALARRQQAEAKPPSPAHPQNPAQPPPVSPFGAPRSAPQEPAVTQPGPFGPPSGSTAGSTAGAPSGAFGALSSDRGSEPPIPQGRTIESPPQAFVPSADRPTRDRADSILPRAPKPRMADGLDGSNDLDGLVIEEPEELENPGTPTLEPPSPPSGLPQQDAMDMWAIEEAAERAPSAGPPKDLSSLQEQPRADAIDEIEIEDITGDQTNPGAQLAPKVAEAAAPAVANAVQDKVPGLPHDELVKIAREVIEQVAWEVVPDLAEAIIRTELDRLLKD